MEAVSYRAGLALQCGQECSSWENLVSWDMHERWRMNLQWLDAPQIRGLGHCRLCLLRRPRAMGGNSAGAEARWSMKRNEAQIGYGDILKDRIVLECSYRFVQ